MYICIYRATGIENHDVNELAHQQLNSNNICIHKIGGGKITIFHKQYS